MIEIIVSEDFDEEYKVEFEDLNKKYAITQDYGQRRDIYESAKFRV